MKNIIKNINYYDNFYNEINGKKFILFKKYLNSINILCRLNIIAYLI